MTASIVAAGHSSVTNPALSMALGVEQFRMLASLPLATGPLPGGQVAPMAYLAKDALSALVRVHPCGAGLRVSLTESKTTQSRYLHVDAEAGRFTFRVSDHPMEEERGFFPRRSGTPVAGRDLAHGEPSSIALGALLEEALHFLEPLVAAEARADRPGMPVEPVVGTVPSAVPRYITAPRSQASRLPPAAPIFIRRTAS